MPRKWKPQTELNKPEPADKRIANRGRLELAKSTDILARYMTDETTYDIASDYGVTRQALSAYLLKHAEEEWKEAQVARAIARKEKAEDALDTAEDPLQLARARELLKSAQWDLERVCRRIYGQDHNLNINLTVSDLGERLRRARERVIDVLATKEVASNAAQIAHARDPQDEIQDAELVTK